ncbi:leucine-rich repeat-containing protein 57-like [Clavelina lepadiformis]|uniref:Leucine-rich repeat-containing protein 57 n=1 Tax=Clavelina lepadiformis TaxID=159417 RepID=A0ABP0GNS0_CLALP
MGNSLKSHIEHAEKTGVCQLSSMNLAQFPAELLRLAKNLRMLDVSNNKIPSLPESIGNFSILKSLNLNHNRLQVLCPGLSKLKKLETLTISNNRLVQLPPDIHHCAALRTLVLSGNKLKTFPSQLSRLKHLDMLDLSQNSLSGLPENFQGLHVVELNLNRNQISVLPPSLAQCSRLKVLRFQENCVTLEGVSSTILAHSNVSLLAYDGNLFSQKDFQSIEGYDKYMERFTATKKKFD